MRMPFIIVFLCENVQLALMVSPRIATAKFMYGIDQWLPNFSIRGPLEKNLKFTDPPLGFEINQTVNVLETLIF